MWRFRLSELHSRVFVLRTLVPMALSKNVRLASVWTSQKRKAIHLSLVRIKMARSFHPTSISARRSIEWSPYEVQLCLRKSSPNSLTAQPLKVAWKREECLVSCKSRCERKSLRWPIRNGKRIKLLRKRRCAESQRKQWFQRLQPSQRPFSSAKSLKKSRMAMKALTLKVLRRSMSITRKNLKSS